MPEDLDAVCSYTLRSSQVLAASDVVFNQPQNRQ